MKSRVLVGLCLVIAALPSACGKRSIAEPSASSGDAEALRSSSAPATPILPTVLATLQVGCDRIVADATHVFWTTRSSDQRFPPTTDPGAGRIWSCATDGCKGGPTLIAEGQSHIDAIAVDANFVYWTVLGFHGVHSAVLKCPRTGCAGAPASVFRYATGGGPGAIAVDKTAVFWTDTEDKTIFSCPKEGCSEAPSVLARLTVRPREIAVAGHVVYWTTFEGTVMRCDGDGCSGRPSIIGAGRGSASEIAVDDLNVYWVNHDFAHGDGGIDHRAEILRCPIVGCTSSPTVLFTTAGTITTLTFEGTDLYWSERGGTEGDGVVACNRDHCMPAMVATGEAARLAVSTAGVFWTDDRSHNIQTVRR